MGKINVTRFRLLKDRWGDPNYVRDIIRLNQLADETISLVNSEPLIKDICEMFMYAVSVKAMADSGGIIK